MTRSQNQFWRLFGRQSGHGCGVSHPCVASVLLLLSGCRLWLLPQQSPCSVPQHLPVSRPGMLPLPFLSPKRKHSSSSTSCCWLAPAQMLSSIVRSAVLIADLITSPSELHLPVPVATVTACRAWAWPGLRPAHVAASCGPSGTA